MHRRSCPDVLVPQRCRQPATATVRRAKLEPAHKCWAISEPGRTRSRRARGRSATSARRAAVSFSSRSKAPICPLRLSIACTSAASRVPGTTGLPCSRQPWWARMMCSSARASSAGKPAIALDLAPHAVVAERDLALELAGVGQVGAAVDVRRRPRACRCRAAARRSTARSRSTPPNTAAAAEASCATWTRVLEQSGAVRVVVELRRGHLAVARPEGEPRRAAAAAASEVRARRPRRSACRGRARARRRAARARRRSSSQRTSCSAADAD